MSNVIYTDSGVETTIVADQTPPIEEYSTDGALLKAPDNLLLKPLPLNMQFIENIVTVHLNNLILSYGEEAVKNAIIYFKETNK